MEPLKEDELAKYNLSILTKPDKAAIGIDTKTGKLYAITGMLGKLTNRIASLAGRNTQVIEASKAAIDFFYKTKKITEPKTYNEFQQLIKKVADTGIFRKEFVQAQVEAWYTLQYLEHIRTGKPEQVAEALVNISMSYDPQIPEEIRKKIAPTKTTLGGISGSYFIRDRYGEKILGVFKPQDEEPKMPNNAEGCAFKPDYVNDPEAAEGKQLRLGQKLGECWKKEIAASLIDPDKFVGVPFTTAINVRFPKAGLEGALTEKDGSFQFYAPDTISVVEMTNREINELPTDQVQKLAIFDLLVGNADRHFGNILWNGEKLVPIDHGIILLDSLVNNGISETKCDWFTLPQIEEPVNPQVNEWIKSVQLNEEALKKWISPDSILELKLRLNFIKLLLSKNYNVKQIAILMFSPWGGIRYRNHLERFVKETFKALGNNRDHEAVLAAFCDKANNAIKSLDGDV